MILRNASLMVQLYGRVPWIMPYALPLALGRALANTFFVLYFQTWISDIRAGTVPSCGNHIKASCSLIAFNSDRPGREVNMVVGIQTLSP